MSDWKTCKRKRLKNSGKEYVSTCSEIMPAKTFAGLSTYCCKQKCTERVTNDECRTIFEGFWNLANHDAQSQFIAGCIRQKDVKTHTLSVLQAASAHQREFSRTYSLHLTDRVVKVCKPVFLSVLGVSAGRVDRILKSQRTNGGVVQTDKRGKCVHLKNSLPAHTSAAVEEHISSFPVNESHYTRSHSDAVKYLSPDLTVTKMYDLYVSE